ncbi:hypothetical protein [Saccharococcus sp. Marseille-Q5394]|uniref:hypothetical protein n=1 Tax=Saccharococcus sp. Marseille-Q5394 TaxID=2972778 RepID=UPI0021C8607F|nr:hypothetical protein [Saccharococcus sp. Marseille-Q5394]
MEFIKNDLEPIKQWICDACGEIIPNAESGWLEWYRDILPDDEIGKNKGYRIVHHDSRCMYNARLLYKENKLTADMHLDHYVGHDGLVSLLSKVQYDTEENNEELVEIIRRLHVPYFEEARQLHHLAEEDGYFVGENEVTRYLTSTSKHILNRYNKVSY